MRLICEYFGEEVLFDNKKIYTFPNPGEINDIDKLILAKTGYRAKYILETNKMVLENPNLLSKINNSDYKTSKELLMKFPGVGPKVADCICLFALGHSEAFPIDTWVKKIIQQLYLKREAKNLKEIEDFINGYFVEHRGLKQQLLFHYMRNEK